MALKNILILILVTELCAIENILCFRINSRLLENFDRGNHYTSIIPRYRREVKDLGIADNAGTEELVPTYFEILDKLMSPVKHKMEILNGRLYFPPPTKNCVTKEFPSSFIRNKLQDSNRLNNTPLTAKEEYQRKNISHDAVLTGDPAIEKNVISHSYPIEPVDSDVSWKKGSEDQFLLNANPEDYNFIENTNPYFKKKIVTVNKFETENGYPNDRISDCYNHCLRNCYDTTPTAHKSHCDSSGIQKPLIININSECSARPSHRFTHRYHFNPRANTMPLKFHSLPRDIPNRSSYQHSEMSRF